MKFVAYPITCSNTKGNNMTAREAISPFTRNACAPGRTVAADMPLISVLPLLLDSPAREVGVEEEGRLLGVIDQTSLLDGLGRMIAPRDDCSIVTVECSPSDYSASSLAHAVEDADVHLVDLLSVPAQEGHLRVLLRVRCVDPTPVVHSLERYGYDVVEVAADSYGGGEAAIERLLEVQALLNV